VLFADDDSPDIPEAAGGLALAPPTAPAPSSVSLQLIHPIGLPGTPDVVTIPLTSYAFGFRRPIPAGNGAGGTGISNATSDDLRVTTAFGADAPALFSSLVHGSHFASAVLTVKDASGRPVAAWVLDRPMVATDSIAGSARGPFETLELAFTAITAT